MRKNDERTARPVHLSRAISFSEIYGLIYGHRESDETGSAPTPPDIATTSPLDGGRGRIDWQVHPWLQQMNYVVQAERSSAINEFDVNWQIRPGQGFHWNNGSDIHFSASPACGTRCAIKFRTLSGVIRIRRGLIFTAFR